MKFNASTAGEYAEN